jgi:Mn-containing catalase
LRAAHQHYRDPAKDALGFLMTRENAHQKPSEKALYAIHPKFPSGKLPGMSNSPMSKGHGRRVLDFA